MVTIEQVKNGLVKYVDAEVLPHMAGAKRFALGVYTALAAQNMEAVLLKYRDNPMIAALSVIDSNNNIDIDGIYNAAMSSMEKVDKFSIDIPLIGVLTLGKTDIAAIYESIKGGS